MDIGIGMPNAIPGATGAQLLEWAQRADAAGFSTLSTIGQLAYPGYEGLTVLAAAGAVTERIRLMSNVLVAPARSAAELAKQAATVDQLSGGRLTLGLGVGWRDMDYTLTGRDFAERGRIFDDQLRELRTAWAGEPIVEGTRPVAPPPVQQPGIPLLIGGSVEASIRRVVEYGVGWTGGGEPPDSIAEMAEKVKEAWKEAGREGQPRIVAMVYFTLGDPQEEARDNIAHYYEPMGSETAEMIAGTILASPDAITGAVDAYAQAGADEFILSPGVSDPEQVDLLAEVVFRR